MLGHRLQSEVYFALISYDDEKLKNMLKEATYIYPMLLHRVLRQRGKKVMESDKVEIYDIGGRKISVMKTMNQGMPYVFNLIK